MSETVLRIYVQGAELGDLTRDDVRSRLGRTLARFGPLITAGTVRFKDVNGPRGGVDSLCRIKLSVVGADHVIGEAIATTASEAFLVASRQVRTALTRALARAGRNIPAMPRAAKPVGRRAAPSRPRAGSLIGRRVGRARENLLRAAARPEKIRRDAWTDTALPGVSATDRKAGGGSTAARNTQLRARRAAVTLEDSAQQRPSRKTTRKSANRQKAATKLERRQRRELQKPSARASRAQHG